MKTSLALVLAAAFLLLGDSLLSFAQSNISQQPQQRAKGIQQWTNDHQYQSNSPMIQIDKNISPKKADASSNNSTKDEDKQMFINRRIMIATWIIALAAIVQIGAMLLQYCTMRRQIKHLRNTVKATEKAAEAAQKSANAADRSANAVVRIESPIIRAEKPRFFTRHPPGYKPKPGDSMPSFPCNHGIVKDLAFTNYGRTPAFPETLSVGWMVAKNLPDNPRYINKSGSGYQNIIREGKTVQYDLEYDIVLTDNDVNMITTENGCFWFYGCFSYRNFMNETQEARFCWKLVNVHPPNTWPDYKFTSDYSIPKEYIKST